MIEFLSGALTLGFVIIGVWFLRFWKRTRDHLFLSFAIAFFLFAANQLLSLLLTWDGEIRYEYFLRVRGYIVILAGIARKNTERGGNGTLKRRAE